MGLAQDHFGHLRLSAHSLKREKRQASAKWLGRAWDAKGCHRHHTIDASLPLPTTAARLLLPLTHVAAGVPQARAGDVPKIHSSSLPPRAGKILIHPPTHPPTHPPPHPPTHPPTQPPHRQPRK